MRFSGIVDGHERKQLPGFFFLQAQVFLKGSSFGFFEAGGALFAARLRRAAGLFYFFKTISS